MVRNLVFGGWQLLSLLGVSEFWRIGEVITLLNSKAPNLPMAKANISQISIAESREAILRFQRFSLFCIRPRM